ncbi:MAG: peptide-methionine (R)-S-oxide reductase MsrB [Akkermansiaceae bacterium]
MRKTSYYLAGFAVVFGLMATLILQAQTQKPMKTSEETPAQPEKTIELTDAEWKAKLTPEQYRIARQGGTEYPNGPVYQQFKKQGAGTYYCAGCDAELFSSKVKFDSHCGWPSFYDPSKAKNVKSLTDADGRRTEVKCAVCDAHLGHVFVGEGFKTPTDKRYCINGTVLKFVPDQVEEVAEMEEKK